MVNVVSVRLVTSSQNAGLVLALIELLGEYFICLYLGMASSPPTPESFCGTLYFLDIGKIDEFPRC